MKRIDRIGAKSKDFNISSGSNAGVLYDNLFRSTWRVTEEEQNYIEQNADDSQLELLTHCEDFAGKRLAIQLRNELVKNYYL